MVEMVRYAKFNTITVFWRTKDITAHYCVPSRRDRDQQVKSVLQSKLPPRVKMAVAPAFILVVDWIYLKDMLA
jgi:hypothetical protein